jgi:putative effector of murein hydrolase
MGDGRAGFASIGMGFNGLITALFAPMLASIFKYNQLPALHCS